MSNQVYDKLGELQNALVDQSNKIQETLELIEEYLVSIESMGQEYDHE